MYPVTTHSSALPKKGIQLLRKISEPCDNNNIIELVQIARESVQYKVVLKRPKEAIIESIWKDQIIHTYEGTKHRFHVFSPIVK